ncbi:chloride channel protein [Paraclostridium bifermentans]|uniref:chloride channel protein n=1 Tax=Paraclostridium bifermentans TaxID=1490 RepID=UPI0018A0B270|nr:chloride channel protein [Paraclostridium bifermentans]
MKSKNILKLILISILIGGISGLFIGIFLIFLEKAVDINLKHKFLVFILPLSGMLMTFLYSKYGGNSQKGNNLIIENINGSKEEIKFIMAPLVFLGTVLTHLFGGSVGREGTGVQIGGTIGNALSKILKCSTYEKKILLISGVAAGFSSVFGTPITGTIFALEISNIGSLNYNSMIPAITSAIVGNSVVKILGVKHSHYKIPPVESVDLTNILKVIILAICFGLASRLFVYMTHWFKEKLIKYCKNQYLKIFVGGSLMVLATLLLGNSLYNNLSLGLLSSAFDGNVSYLAFIIKLMLTTLCLGAGYQGGEVTPLFVIGATLGATLSNILGLPFAFSAALGLVGVFSGATNAPIACFMMYLELFGSNNIIFAMLVCMIAVFISGHKGIYTSQLWNE